MDSNTKPRFPLILLLIVVVSCNSDRSPDEIDAPYYLGADLSYVNEMEDCGGEYFVHGEKVEPFGYFANMGANIVRLRLWHNPDWTNYSNYNDVVKSVRRAKTAGMAVLLNFHYSDTWADPGDQIIPAAWKGITDRVILGDSLYQYTLKVLLDLSEEGLTPEIVQIGNETNSEILMRQPVDETSTPINWERNAHLLNRGIEAVKDAAGQTGKSIETMLHIAQPENAFEWFDDAIKYGVTEFDWIGLSYYPLWSDYQIPEAAGVIDSLKKKFGRRIMVVETAYPYVIREFDQANNILWTEAVLEDYPATPEGQLNYMMDLTQEVIDGGGSGVIYWEPAWISTGCSTRWGVGSHWENATFFDASNKNEALPAFNFLNQSNYRQ